MAPVPGGVSSRADTGDSAEVILPAYLRELARTGPAVRIAQLGPCGQATPAAHGGQRDRGPYVSNAIGILSTDAGAEPYAVDTTVTNSSFRGRNGTPPGSVGAPAAIWLDAPLPTNSVTAGGNWWGDADGPNAPPDYNNECGGLISEHVAYGVPLQTEPEGIGPSACPSP